MLIVLCCDFRDKAYFFSRAIQVNRRGCSDALLARSVSSATISVGQREEINSSALPLCPVHPVSAPSRPAISGILGADPSPGAFCRRSSHGYSPFGTTSRITLLQLHTRAVTGKRHATRTADGRGLFSHASPGRNWRPHLQGAVSSHIDRRVDPFT